MENHLPLAAIHGDSPVSADLEAGVFLKVAKNRLREIRGHDPSVSEIEFCTLYVVAERWILGCILRFMRANNHFSDTLIPLGSDPRFSGQI